MASSENPPSLDNPTWEFLHSNYRKTDLQKHCREIGITKVFVTKEKLIDQIMEKHRSSRHNDPEVIAQVTDSTPQDAMNGM